MMHPNIHNTLALRLAPSEVYAVVVPAIASLLVVGINLGENVLELVLALLLLVLLISLIIVG